MPRIPYAYKPAEKLFNTNLKDHLKQREQEIENVQAYRDIWSDGRLEDQAAYDEYTRRKGIKHDI